MLRAMRVCPRCGAVFRAEVLSCSSDGATLVSREDDPLIGSQLGRFILEALIAEGVTGRLYKAQEAVVRVLYGDFGAQELIVQRLMRDVEAARNLQHPNTARILDAGTDDGSVFIATEHAEGRPLQTWVAEERIDAQTAGNIAAQIAASLAEAHELNILHRNLSPTNVVVDGSGDALSVRVLDFGLGSVARASQAIRFRTSRDYAAPEALRPSGASPAGDVYSLGLLLKDLLSEATGDEEGLESLAERMTATAPSARPQSGREALDRLGDLGFSALELLGTQMSEDLASDLEADGLVVVGHESETPDRAPTSDGLLVAQPRTSYVFNEDQRDAQGPAEEIDVEASRKKLGFAEPSPRKKPPTSNEKPAAPKAVLQTKPVAERHDTVLDAPEAIGSDDLEPFDDSTGGSGPSFFEGSVVHSAADLGKKAVGGVSSLPAESSVRPRPSFVQSGPQPKGSWPTADLVLPNRSSAPDDDHRSPTSLIRPRGPSGPSPDRRRQETLIIRQRSRPGDAPTGVESLPIDRTDAAQDPAEASLLSGDLVKPVSGRRRLVPFAVGAVILIGTAAAIALPRLGEDRPPKQVTRPVLIQAKPDEPPVEKKDEEVAALPPDPVEKQDPKEEDPPEEKPGPTGTMDPEEPPDVAPLEAEPPEPPPAEAPEKVVEPEEPKVKPLPEEQPAVKPKKRQKKERRRKLRRRRARRRPRRESPSGPKKLEKGTLIDPFAE